MVEHISLVEQMVMNPDYPDCKWHPKAMAGWRNYRIEYGFECSCPEGVIWLPPEVDSQVVEDFLEGLCGGEVSNEKG